MGRKRMSKHAQKVLNHSSGLMAKALELGGTPAIVISSRPVNRETGELEYSVASTLTRKEILYILTRVAGLMDGSIVTNN